MSKKKERPEAEGYNYMDTYGDLVTLLLTFFVLLYAFSSTDAGKWEMLVQAFTGRPPSSAIAVELTPVNVGAKSFTENTAGDSNQMAQDNPEAGAGGYSIYVTINNVTVESISSNAPQGQGVGNLFIPVKAGDVVAVRVINVSQNYNFVLYGIRP